MYFLVQVDKYNLPRYLFFLLLAFAPLGSGGSISSLPIMIIELMIAVTFLTFWLASWSRHPKAPASRLDLFLFFFLIIALISFSLASYKHNALYCLLLILGCIASYYLVLFNFSRSTIRGPVIVLILSAVLQGVIGLFQYALLKTSHVTGTFPIPNFYAGFLVAVFPLSLGEFLLRRTNPLWYLANGIILAGIFLSGSREAIFSLFIVSLFLLYLFQKKKIVLSLLLVILALVILPTPFKGKILRAGENDIHVCARLSAWRSALAIIKDYWKTGIGLGQYRYISTAYTLPVEGSLARYANKSVYAHNEYLHSGAEFGLFGLFLILAAIAWFFHDALSQVQIQRFLSIENKRTQIFLLAGILAILTLALLNCDLHSPAIALLLTILAALFRTLDERAPAKSFCFAGRKVYRIPIALILIGYVMASVRPFLGYYFFQKVDRSRKVTQNIHLLKRAAAIDSLCAAYRDSLGGAYFAQYGESLNVIWLLKGVEQAEMAMKLNPNDYQFPRSMGDGYYNLYWSTFKNSNYLIYAEEEFLEALRLAPFDYRLYSRLASVKYLQGMLKEALEYMTEAVLLEPYYLKGHYQLALIRKKMGDAAGAAKEYTKIRELYQLHLEDKATSAYEAELVDFDYSCLELNSRHKQAI
ncbi:MAG: O-antigen ligase family protein [bacterium]